jgi:uncharacterized protein YkwD
MLARHHCGNGGFHRMTGWVPFGSRVALIALAGALVAGCLGDRDPPSSSDPTFYRSMASSAAQVDAAAAAAMISGYRKNNGLGAVTVDPTLMKLAAEQAHAMATRDKLGHDVAGGFGERVAASGYRARGAYENVGAGYHTLSDAFSGWRGSSGHRENMLRREVTQIGIAAAYAPRSKYKVFWALILASPDNRVR